MSANLDVTTGVVALAFTGPRSKIWHGTGQSIDQAAKAAGRNLTLGEIWNLAACDFTVAKVPLMVDLAGAAYDHLEPAKRIMAYPDRFAHVRQDTGAPLGIGSGQYQIVQPSDIRDTFERYIGLDDRFHITTVGAIDGGRRIWAQAQFNGTETVGGDAHKRHLLMSTTFDTTAATTLRLNVTRVVCENTWVAAKSEKAPVVSVRHSATFDADKARKDLAKIAAGFEAFKVCGDALAAVKLTPAQISSYIRDVLDIPRDASPDDVSTRKRNQRQAIIDALCDTANERAITTAANIDAFAAWQAVTRYVDHTRDSDSVDNRMFGSGATLKDEALGLLMPYIPDADRLVPVFVREQKKSVTV